MQVIPNSLQTINSTLDDTGERTVALLSQGVSTQVNPLPDQTPRTFMERLYPVGTVSWNTADTIMSGAPLAVIYPFGLLMACDANNDALSYFQYFRSDMEIQFRLNTTQFYSGALMITAVPYFSAASTPPFETYAWARSWNKPFVISAQKQDTLIIQLPWELPWRFQEIANLENAAGVTQIRPWSIYIDVIAPLVSSAPSATNVISLTIQGRFQNPQLVFPVDPSGSRRRHHAQKQSGQTQAPSMRPGRGGMGVLHANRGGADPVRSAQSGTAPTTAESLPNTIVSTIADASSSVMGVLSSLQPLVSMFSGLFDKPNDPQPPMRVIAQPGETFTRSDVTDYSMPLAMYKTSYLAAAKLPDGGDWTWQKLAMRPAIASCAQITDSSPSNSIPLPPFWTPVGYAIASHEMWHSSFRILLQFFASTFVSARIVITLAPQGVPITGSIQDQVTRVIDVKGDTEVQFTIPYIYFQDFMLTPNLYAVLDVALYPGTSIIATDATLTNTISLVAWISAGPDCQFSGPQPPVDYIYEPAAAQKQSGILEKFDQTFAPFVQDCSYYTDNHFCVSETSGSVIDTFKRYVSIDPVAPLAGNYPLYYSPDQQSLQATLASCFLYWRGGIMYKRIRLLANDSVIQARWNTPNTLTFGSYSALGAPYIVQSSQEAEFDVTMPYMALVPFQTRITFGIYPTQTYNTLSYQDLSNTGGTAINGLIYTAVRDDYQVGWLIAPVKVNTSLLKDEPLQRVRSHQILRAPPARTKSRPPAKPVQNLPPPPPLRIKTFDF